MLLSGPDCALAPRRRSLTAAAARSEPDKFWKSNEELRRGGPARPDSSWSSRTLPVTHSPSLRTLPRAGNSSSEGRRAIGGRGVCRFLRGLDE